MAPKQSERRKSIFKTQSRIITGPDHLEGGEEIEIAAQISLPHDGGWGWVVVIASFLSIFILDGVVYTFGCLLADIANDLETEPTLIALINSISVSLYLMMGPVVSAFINRFGFRACIMSGSVLCSFSLCTSYFVTNYGLLCAFYGVLAGVGYAFINMSSGLVVGFFFQRLRSIALAITTCGSSFGVMSLNLVNSELVKVAGWRPVTLLHSGMFGLIFFLGMTFRPIVSLTVTKTEAGTEDPTKTVTYLPNLSAITEHTETTANDHNENNMPAPTATERILHAISNSHFPTAAAIVEDTLTNLPTTTLQAGPSTAGAVSRITLTSQKPLGAISRLQMKQVQTAVSKLNELDKTGKIVELAINVQEQEQKTSCWGRLFHWDKHDSESRPMYRDDVFYEGKIEKLPTYQKSVMKIAPDVRTGLEYQLAVSRAATTADLKERRGVFTTAVRRVLATMMDPKLLKLGSFVCMCFSGFFTYLGFLVPYVYLQDRNKTAGIDVEHCQWFISVIGLSNAFGRLILGSLASKLDPLKMFSFSCFTAGVATMCSDLSYQPFYQYSYCVVFGFCIASVASLRSIVLVNLYGLDKLTNATGMILLFQGLGSLGSTPLAGALKSQFGYRIAFIVAGLFIAISGLILGVAIKIAKKESKKAKAYKESKIPSMKNNKVFVNNKNVNDNASVNNNNLPT